MATLVCLHAHPDDEAMSTGGTMARAKTEGHRVVLVVATNGEHGEVPEDLQDGETLVDRRRSETEASAAALGVDRVVWLGFGDSGMTGWDQNTDPSSFHQADVDDAAGLLAEVLREELADVLTTYDWHGNYGHPDHVKVHHVGHRAAQLAGTPRVLEATMNRDAIVRMMEQHRETDEVFGPDAADFDPNGPADDGNPFGTAEVDITLAVDVEAFVGHKRAAIAAHRSQATDTTMFLEMPEEIFRAAFGTEWYIEPGVEGTGPRPGWIFP
jgi:LmbE family N-acetylglucosaminyl deacetylase